MERGYFSWTTTKVVSMILLFLLSSLPNVSSQQNPYAPEIDYFCNDSVRLNVDYEWSYAIITCSISNNNPHEVTVKISEEWENSVSGPYEVSEYGICMQTELGDEISVQASSTESFCYKISADKYTTEGISILKSTAEVMTYLNAIPCDECEPVNEEVQVEIMPWITLTYDYSVTPESAYGYYRDRVICDKSDFSELILDITADGNFLGTVDFPVDFYPQWSIYDMTQEGYVNYEESTIGKLTLEYNSEVISFEAKETVQRSFKASWDIREDAYNYDITLWTRVDIYDGLVGLSLLDTCPTWEGTLPTQEIKVEEKSSKDEFNLNSSFSISLSIISTLMAAVVFRKE